MTFAVGNCRYLTFCAAAESYLKKRKKKKNLTRMKIGK